MAKFGQQVRWDIAKSVTLASVFYFLYHGGKACLLPFLTLYFRRIGLTATQVGVICSLKSLAWFITAPIWTVMAKKYVCS